MTMSLLHRLRRRQRRLALLVLPLFCLVWLQLAAAPCAAAHSAPADTHQHASADGPPCPWCPPADGGHCDDGSRCAFPHEPQVDARLPLVFLPAPEAAVHPVSADLPVQVLVAAGDRPEPVPRRSLAIHYCRFIE